MCGIKQLKNKRRSTKSKPKWKLNIETNIKVISIESNENKKNI